MSSTAGSNSYSKLKEKLDFIRSTNVVSNIDVSTVHNEEKTYFWKFISEVCIYEFIGIVFF